MLCTSRANETISPASFSLKSWISSIERPDFQAAASSDAAARIAFASNQAGGSPA